MTIAPHTPDTNRLAVEADLITTVATALDLPDGRVTAGYFAALGRAVVTVTGCRNIPHSEDTSRAAADALSEAGYPLHFANFGRRGPARGVGEYRAEIAVNVR
ncbi:hypothetical protein ACWFMI_25080 [Nocardiopsis terrae]|uniref:hypothetical protein n=1 Tax=Streptomyces sp. NPDC057554 TaxID=3350538 RepID=UPI0036B4DB2B